MTEPQTDRPSPWDTSKEDPGKWAQKRRLAEAIFVSFQRERYAALEAARAARESGRGR